MPTKKKSSKSRKPCTATVTVEWDEGAEDNLPNQVANAVAADHLLDFILNEIPSGISTPLLSKWLHHIQGKHPERVTEELRTNVLSAYLN